MPTQSVTLLQMDLKPALIIEGQLVEQNNDGLSLSLNAPAPRLSTGMQVVLKFPTESRRPNLVVTLTKVQGTQLEASVRVSHMDHRASTRIYTGLNLTYHILDTDHKDMETVWLAGSNLPQSPHTPDPYMNISITGLSFRDKPTCKAGDTLLIAVGIPKKTKTWRGTAKVVRIFPLSEDEREEGSEATHEIAISFEKLPDEARKALAERTNKTQEALLRGIE